MRRSRARCSKSSREEGCGGPACSYGEGPRPRSGYGTWAVRRRAGGPECLLDLALAEDRDEVEGDLGAGRGPGADPVPAGTSPPM